MPGQDYPPTRTNAMAEPQFNPETPPEFVVAQWFNASEPLSLAKLKGKVVMLVGFQMLCPGSVRHALPQAERLARTFNANEVAILGLHMVFDNHDSMTPSQLEPFLKSEKITIPVAVDQPNGSGVPKTMAAYGMQGTPALLLFDRQGRLRRYYLGAVDDARLSAEIMALSLEAPDAPREVSMAIEQRLASVISEPEGHHHHDHDGDCCGGHHDHEHAHGDDCCGGDHAHSDDCCGDEHAHGEGCGCKH